MAIEAINQARRRAGRRARRWAVALALLAFVAPATRASAQPLSAPSRSPGAHRDWPCPGCIMLVPPSYSPERPAPLMVALHGDGASTDLIVRMWKEPLERRGYLLLALRCPRDLGCENSFWRWHGDPAWIMAKVDAVEAAYSIDPARVYLSGWSGGSTYMGLSAPLLSPRFAAINLNGGGVPPPSGACGQCKPPVYYFVGSKNPMLSLVKATADHFKRCGHELVWDLGMDMDHPGELQAIFAGPVAERVVAWLDTKRNACIEPRVSAPEEAGAGDGAPGAVAIPSENPNSVELTSKTSANTGVSQAAPAFGAPDPGSLHSGRALSPTPPPVPGGCGCRPGAVARGPSEASHTSSAWLVVLAAGLVEARRRSHRRQI